MIRHVETSDAADICEIYNTYVRNTRITFEETALTENEICDRIKNITRKFPWLVYEDAGKVVGYTYASTWKDRSAYRYSVEAGIYIDAPYFRKGIGTKLMEALLKE